MSRGPMIVRAGEMPAFPDTRPFQVDESWSAIRRACATGVPARDPARASSARVESPPTP